MSEPLAVALQEGMAADEVLAQRMYAHVSPQTSARSIEPIEPNMFHSLGVPRSYPMGTHDPMPRDAKSSSQGQSSPWTALLRAGETLDN
ncbi:hypothetical protein ACVWWN_008241 [Mycobacterium sp. URHB0021]|jgi:hypothetical protein